MAGLLAESDFAFTVKKTPTAMEITINHPVLQGDVLDALAGASLGLEPEEVSFDGLQLLKYKHEIKNKQYEIKECIIEDQRQADRVAMFSLLYEFVDDPQTFESYNLPWPQESYTSWTTVYARESFFNTTTFISLGHGIGM